jgi:SAM-dependent methyltransferase
VAKDPSVKAAKRAKASGAGVTDVVAPVVWYMRHPLLKSAFKAQKKWRREIGDRLESAYYRFNVRRAHTRLQRRFGAVDGSYDTYLREQLEETLRKKRLFGRVSFDVVPLVDMLASKHDFRGQSVLCVGARQDDEIRYFRTRGAGRVVGIDLYDAPPDIVTMDMHDLKFPDGSFDVVYSRHSFEHAYDKRKAGLEFVRVLKPDGVVVIEVPGKVKGGGDYNLFNGFDDVLEAFEPHVGEFLWREYSRKEENTDKMDIIRLMFRVRKA